MKLCPVIILDLGYPEKCLNTPTFIAPSSTAVPVCSANMQSRCFGLTSAMSIIHGSCPSPSFIFLTSLQTSPDSPLRPYSGLTAHSTT